MSTDPVLGQTAPEVFCRCGACLDRQRDGSFRDPETGLRADRCPQCDRPVGLMEDDHA